MVGNLTRMDWNDYRRAKAHQQRYILAAFFGREMRHRHRRRMWRMGLRRLRQ